MRFADAEKLAENLKASNPTDTFLAVRAVCCSYAGSDVLQFGGCLVLQLTYSAGPTMPDAEVKERAFSCIFESRTLTDTQHRLDFIYNKLVTIFPALKVNLFLFEEGQSTEYFITDPPKGTAFFEQFGHAVLVILM